MFRNKHHCVNKKNNNLNNTYFSIFYDETLKQNTCVYKGLHKKNDPLSFLALGFTLGKIKLTRQIF